MRSVIRLINHTSKRNKVRRRERGRVVRAVSMYHKTRMCIVIVQGGVKGHISSQISLDVCNI